MRIERIETFTCEHVGLVRVTAEGGTQGWGQMRDFWHCGAIPSLVFEKKIVPLVLGESADDIGALLDLVRLAEYRCRGSYLAKALAGLDTALWDLHGKKAGMSVASLLGARRDSLPAYAATIHRTTTPAEEAQKLKAVCDRCGFRAVKTRIGTACGNNADAAPGRTKTLIPLLRCDLGDSTVLMADANGGYDAHHAVSIGRMLEDSGYVLFEEPCPYWDLDATARVAGELDIQVGGGEQDWDPAQWRRILAQSAVDVVQPDICDGGGFSAARHVAELAAQSGRKVMPHSSDRSLCLVFTLHLMAALCNAGDFVEYSIEDEPWTDALFDPAPAVVDGSLRVPDGPGWGVEIRESWLARAERNVFTMES